MESRLQTALKRVDDLLTEHPINGKVLAFNEIQHIISGSRHKETKTWSEELESLMKKFLHLAVELRKAKEAKYALQNYKQYCVGTNVNSFDNVLGLHMDLAENRLRKASKEANKVQDENEDNSVEAKMMKYVAGEDTDDRTDKEYLAPWIQYAYDAFRNVMDILKMNVALEKRYHNAALRAFTLCKDFKRVIEFRKVCESIRKHYSYIQENTRNPKEHKQPRLTLTHTTLQHQLRTRFKQLSAATSLSLWQDAFRCVQDINDIMEDMEEQPSRRTMKKYYEELSKIFMVSQDYALYAYSLLQLFGMTEKDENKSNRATIFLLAVLSIPVDYDKAVQEKEQYEKQAHLSRLLGLTHMLSKEELLRDMLDQNILAYIDTSISEAYNILEGDFSPLEMCQQMQNVFDVLRENEQYAKFIAPLKRTTATKYLSQLSEVYDNIEMESALSYSSGLFTREELEESLISLAASNQVYVTLHHETDNILFAQGLNAFETETFRGSLQKFNHKLQHVCKTIRADAAKRYRERHLQLIRSTRAELDNIRATNQQDFQYNARVAKFKSEHAKVQDVVVEEQFEETKAKEAEEERRLQEEETKRVARDREREAQEAKKQEQMKLLYSQLTDTATAASMGKVTTKKVDTLIQKKQEELEKKKLEKEKRMTKTVRNMNYLERALREAEADLLDSRHTSDEAAAKQAYENRIKKIETRQKQQLEVVKKEHELLKDVFPEQDNFRKAAFERRRKAYEERLKAYNEEVAQATALWEERRKKIKVKVDEIQAQKQEEQQRREQEEAEAQERERIDREAREAAEAKNLREAQEKEEAERRQEYEEKRKAAEAKGIYLPPRSAGSASAPSGDSYRPPYARGDAPSSNAYRPPAFNREGSTERSDVYKPKFGRASEAAPTSSAWRKPESSRGAYKPPLGRSAAGATGSGYVPPHLRGRSGGDSAPSSSGAYRPRFRDAPAPSGNVWKRNISAAEDLGSEGGAPKPWRPASLSKRAETKPQEQSNSDEQPKQDAVNEEEGWSVVGKK